MAQRILFCGWRRDIDDMIVVSSNFSSLFNWMLQVWRGHLPRDFIVPKSEEKILFCGWRRDMEDMIMVMLQGIYKYDLIPWVQSLVN